MMRSSPAEYARVLRLFGRFTAPLALAVVLPACRHDEPTPATAGPSSTTTAAPVAPIPATTSSPPAQKAAVPVPPPTVAVAVQPPVIAPVASPSPPPAAAVKPAAPAPPPQPPEPEISKAELFRQVVAVRAKVMSKASDDPAVRGLFEREQEARRRLDERKQRLEQYDAMDDDDVQIDPFGYVGGRRGIAERFGDAAGRLTVAQQIPALKEADEILRCRWVITRNERAWEYLTEEERTLCGRGLPNFQRLGTGTFAKEWELAEKDISETDPKADALMRHGKLAAEVGLSYIAWKDFSQAADLGDPQCSAEAAYRAAEAQYKVPEYEAAKKTLMKLLASSPGQYETQARACLGRCRFYLKDYEGAITDFTAVLEKEAHDLDVLVHRFYAYNILGQAGKAREDAERAAKLDPNDQLSVLARTVLLVDEGKFEEAEAAVSKAIEANPWSLRLYRWRGQIKGRSGRLQAGLRDQDEAIELSLIQQNW